MSVHRVARPLPTLALFGVAVLLATLAVVQAIEEGTRPRLLADALTLDLVLTVPLAYWFLAVRGAGWPRLSVLPVFVLCVVTTRIVPGLETGRLLPRIEWIAIPAELLLLTVLARRAVAMSRALRRSAGGDALESLRRAAFEMVRAERAAEVIAYEAAVLWYAVAGGGSRETDQDAETFGVRRRSGYGPVLAALLLALTAEAIAVHLLVRHWSSAAAWVLTILTAYAVVWLIGDFRALGRRPILLTDDELVVRLGLRWTVRVPLAGIRAVRGAEPEAAGSGPPARRAARGGAAGRGARLRAGRDGVLRPPPPRSLDWPFRGRARAISPLPRASDRGARKLIGTFPARYTPAMAIIDEELFVRCVRCGSEAATGIRRTEAGLRERPPGERRITCHRCGAVAAYEDGAFYHRTVEADRDRVDVRP